VIPHRAYRDGFLFNKLADCPEGEGQGSTTLDTAGPLFNRNYFGVFTDQYITHQGKKYFAITPKEVLAKGMELKYFSPDKIGILKILDILDTQKNSLEKATCNTGEVWILTDHQLSGWEILYA
jgi:hypothetical protein